MSGRSRCPPASQTASARAAWDREGRLLLRLGLCWWLPRRRRNMASKAAPSCRLVFCLLISAAVLRPGEQGPPSNLWPTWAGGSFLRSQAPALHHRAVRPGPRCVGKVKGRRSGRRVGPGFSHLCHTFGLAGWLKFAQRRGHWVNLQELWVRPRSGLQGPASRIHLALFPSLCGSCLGGELLPTDNPVSKSQSSRHFAPGSFPFA